MFYLRLNKLRINSNGTLLGMSEMQLMSFVTMGDMDFPMLNEFYRTTDSSLKKELVTQAVRRVLSARVMPEVQRIKDNQVLYFGDTGYNVFVSDTIPDNVNWMLLAVKSNDRTVDNAALIREIITDSTISTMVMAVSKVANVSNPVAAAITTITSLVADSILKICSNAHDHQLGLLLTSFTRAEHYPYGKRDAQDVPDATGNMRVDYTIFGF